MKVPQCKLRWYVGKSRRVLQIKCVSSIKKETYVDKKTKRKRFRIVKIWSNWVTLERFS